MLGPAPVAAEQPQLWKQQNSPQRETGQQGRARPWLGGLQPSRDPPQAPVSPVLQQEQRFLGTRMGWMETHQGEGNVGAPAVPIGAPIAVFHGEFLRCEMPQQAVELEP